MSSEGPKSGNLPATIDRAAVERVLARALELQSGAAGDTTDRLTQAQLLHMAKEVGLDPVNLRQALAEERTRVAVPEEKGLLATLYGGASVSAQRTIVGTPSQVLQALDDWMQRQECLKVKRHFGERIGWEAGRRVASPGERRGQRGEARRERQGRCAGARDGRGRDGDRARRDARGGAARCASRRASRL